MSLAPIRPHDVFQRDCLSARRLPGTRTQLPVPIEATEDGGRWVPTNPCITEAGVFVRQVNYMQSRGRCYISTDSDKKSRSKYVVGGPFSEWSGVDLGPQKMLSDTGRLIGLEDMRLVWDEWGLWGTATCGQWPGYIGMPQVVTVSVKPSPWRVTEVRLAPYAYKVVKEKNWLPWSSSKWGRVVKRGRVLIYGWSPLTILCADTGDVIVRRYHTTLDTSRWRGSAAPVWHKGRWLALVHEVLRLETRNVYVHRMVELSETGRPMSASAPFYFDHIGVEYACGMISEGGALTISYGVEDCQAWSVCTNQLETLDTTPDCVLVSVQ
jgi:hypothetical protein